MMHYDFTLDIDKHAGTCAFDAELALRHFGWKPGQLLEVCCGPGGQVALRPVDPVVAFVQGYAQNHMDELTVDQPTK
jgi:hypothetical protein